MTSTLSELLCLVAQVFAGLNGVAFEFHDHFEWEKLSRDLAEIVSKAAT